MKRREKRFKYIRMLKQHSVRSFLCVIQVLEAAIAGALSFSFFLFFFFSQAAAITTADAETMAIQAADADAKINLSII